MSMDAKDKLEWIENMLGAGMTVRITHGRTAHDILPPIYKKWQEDGHPMLKVEKARGFKLESLWLRNGNKHLCIDFSRISALAVG